MQFLSKEGDWECPIYFGTGTSTVATPDYTCMVTRMAGLTVFFVGMFILNERSFFQHGGDYTVCFSAQWPITAPTIIFPVIFQCMAKLRSNKF